MRRKTNNPLDYILIILYLFITFYIFAVEYPAGWRFFYEFLEKIMAMKSTVQPLLTCSAKFI